MSFSRPISRSQSLVTIKDPSLINPEEDVKEALTWVNAFELSKPHRNLHRDFSDAVMMAELVAIFFPRTVELHNYPSASSTAKKSLNWSTLNRKVLSKIGLHLTEEMIEALAHSEKGAIEKVFIEFRKIVQENQRASELEAASANLDAENGSGDCGEEVEHYAWIGETLVHVSGRGKCDTIVIDSVRYVRDELAQENSRRLGELEETNKMLNHKIQRLETTISLKEESIVALTDQIRDLLERTKLGDSGAIRRTPVNTQRERTPVSK